MDEVHKLSDSECLTPISYLADPRFNSRFANDGFPESF
jgi:hypothetical protein